MLDRLTTSIEPHTSTDDIVDALVAGLMPTSPEASGSRGSERSPGKHAGDDRRLADLVPSPRLGHALLHHVIEHTASGGHAQGRAMLTKPPNRGLSTQWPRSLHTRLVRSWHDRWRASKP